MKKILLIAFLVVPLYATVDTETVTLPNQKVLKERLDLGVYLVKQQIISKFAGRSIEPLGIAREIDALNYDWFELCGREMPISQATGVWDLLNKQKPLLLEALEIRRRKNSGKVLTQCDAEFLSNVNTIANLYQNRGNYQRALPLLKEGKYLLFESNTHSSTD